MIIKTNQIYLYYFIPMETIKEEKKADYKARLDKTMQRIEDMAELINLFRLLIYDTDLSNDERVEKIWNAINIFYDKYED